MLDPAGLRAAFPVLSSRAYLNAGTDGPVPGRAVLAATAELEREAAEGRHGAHFVRRFELSAQLRSRYAALLGAASEDVAVATCTTEGVARVLNGLDFRAGDEIVTSDEEHPGVLGPLRATRERCGVQITVAPFDRVADAVSLRTRLVACSHVSWVTGRLAGPELARLDGVPLLLDGAQAVGAVPVDVRALGCAAYAAAGQKWLCGPDGSGMLYVAPEFRERIAMRDPGYTSFVDANLGLDAELHPDARRYEPTLPAAEIGAFAVAAHDVLGEAGWPAVHERGPALAGRLVELLAERGVSAEPRGETTLVSFPVDDPEQQRERLAEAGVVVRDIPGRGLLRASVGAWNDESDLERLLAGL